MVEKKMEHPQKSMIMNVVNTGRKKIILLILCLTSIFTFTACTNNRVEKRTESKNKNVSQVKQNENYEEPRVIIPENDLVYINDKAGYRIVFPDNWKGNYIITEYSPNEVCIGFYGKSRTGQIGIRRHVNRQGLDIGWVLLKDLDEGVYVNTSEYLIVMKNFKGKDGKEFSVIPALGGPKVGILDLIANGDEVLTKAADYEIDENELKLAEQDFPIALEMKKDWQEHRINFEALKE